MDESNWLLEVLEAIPDGVVIADKNGVMLLVNRELERITGYARTELLGSAVEVLIPHDLVGRHEGHRLGYQANPHRRAMGHGMELSARRKDGSVFPVEISLAPSEVAGDTVVIAGKGHRRTQEIEGSVIPFDDAVVACESLAERGFVGSEI